MRIPLQTLTVLHRQQGILDELRPLEGYMQEELNVKEIVYSTAEAEKVTLSAKPNAQLLGPRFGKAFGQIRKRITDLAIDQMLILEAGDSIQLNGDAFQPEEIQILRHAREGLPDIRSDRFISIDFPCELNDDLIAEGLAREVVHCIQQLRKEAGYQVEDRIAVSYEADGRLHDAITQHKTYIQQETLAHALVHCQPGGDQVQSVEIDGANLTVGVQRESA